MPIRAVLLDVDFTLARPGPELEYWEDED